MQSEVHLRGLEGELSALKNQLASLDHVQRKHEELLRDSAGVGSASSTVVSAVHMVDAGVQDLEEIFVQAKQLASSDPRKIREESKSKIPMLSMLQLEHVLASNKEDMGQKSSAAAVMDYQGHIKLRDQEIALLKTQVKDS